MAFHQNLEHFTKVVLAEVLRAQFGTPEMMASYSSPNSRLSLITMGRVLKGDPELYAEIQTQNLQGAKMLQEYLRIAGEIGRALIQGDASHFAQVMRRRRTCLGGIFWPMPLTPQMRFRRQPPYLSPAIFCLKPLSIH